MPSPLPPRQESTRPGRHVVIVFGPALPGRAALARALERRLPAARRYRASAHLPLERLRTALAAGELPIVEGDFPRVSDRIEARALLEGAGAEVLFVEWICDPAEARREIYHRYARLPGRFADKWWAEWQADAARREPYQGEVPPQQMIAASARGSVLDHVVRVAAALGLEGPLPPRAPPKPRVLVVDDDDDSREVVAQALEAYGCEVLRAASAEEALAIALSEPLDLVLTDQRMPGATGTDLAAELWTRRPDVHVVVLTGYAEETIEVARSTSGVDLLLAKPVSGSDLMRLLDELANHAEAA